MACKLRCFAPLAIRLVMGGLFLTSGLQKLGHMESFYQMAAGYKVLSGPLLHFYATALPWFEILAGAYLLLGLFTRFAALLTAGMLVSFLIAIGMVLMRGEAIDCGCFLTGPKSSPVDGWLLLRDVVMLAAVIYLARAGTTFFSLDAWLQGKPASSD